MVAPVNSTVPGIPSEVVVGTDEGLDHTSAINLDHVQTVAKARLRSRQGRLSGEKMREVCRALAVATGCDLLE
jgi:mRNA interferase MazF